MRRRVAIAAEAAGIDLDAAFGWTLLRAGLEVSWASALGDEAELSHHIALTKALDD
jgi:streptomycin 6-kinase